MVKILIVEDEPNMVAGLRLRCHGLNFGITRSPKNPREEI